MASLNRVLLAGNLTRDPEVGYTSTGVARSDLSLAVDRTYLSEGQSKKETCFIGVVVWGRQAEVCREYLSKGSPVLIDGSLQLDKWTSKEGENRSKLRVKAMRVQFLGSPGGGESREGKARGSASAGAPAEPAAAAEAEAPPGRPAEERPAEDRPADDDNLPF